MTNPTCACLLPSALLVACYRRSTGSLGCLRGPAISPGLVSTSRPPECLAAPRSGLGRRCGKPGQVAQRVAEMFRAERREMEVLPDELRHRRPVVGERDLRLGR